MKNKKPSPDDYSTLGISCGYGQDAVDVTYEHNAFPQPDGKHRWKYKCRDENGDESDWKYTNWIYN